LVFFCLSFPLFSKEKKDQKKIEKNTITLQYVRPPAIILKNVSSIYMGKFDLKIHYKGEKEANGKIIAIPDKSELFKTAGLELKESIANIISQTGIFEVINSSDVELLAGGLDSRIKKANQAFDFKADALLTGSIHVDIFEIDGTTSIIENLGVFDEEGNRKETYKEVAYPFSTISGAIVIEYEIIRLQPYQMIHSQVVHDIFGGKVSDFQVTTAKSIAKKIGSGIGQSLLKGLFGKKEGAGLNRSITKMRQNKGERMRKKRMKESREKSLEEIKREEANLPAGDLKQASFALLGTERGILPPVQNFSRIIRKLGNEIATSFSPANTTIKAKVMIGGEKEAAYHLLAGNFKRAEEILQNPSGKKTYIENIYNHGLLLEIKGKLDEAMEKYSQVLGMKDSSKEAALGLGRVIMKKMARKKVKSLIRHIKEVRSNKK